ncbi:unnamed protein product [Effrenium voratum]|nr:unnamed protein product [Effrenium voratum]
MLEVLKVERDPETYILQVDDDQRYGPTLLASLLRAAGPLPGRALGAGTQHAPTHLGLGGVVLEGVHGALFRRKFFDDSVFDFTGFAPHCQLHDDLWLSAHLARKAISREVLGARFGSKALSFGFGPDALYMGGAGSDNTKNFFLCSASLLKAFPQLWAQETRVVVVAPLDRGWRAFSRLAGLVNAVYLLGQVPKKLPVDSLRVSGGARLVLGAWNQPLELLLQRCGNCNAAEAFDTVLRFEEDPATAIIHLSAVPRKGLRSLVRRLLRCTKVRSRKLCRAEDGVVFRRHAAYDTDRIQGAIFMPKVSEDFYAHHRGLLWRDSSGSWRTSESQGHHLARLRQHSQQDTVVRAWLAQSVATHRRVVALLPWGLWRLARASRLRGAWRSYVPVKVRRKMTRCLPAAAGSRFRLRVMCLQRGLPLLELLLLEQWPKTLIFLAGHRGATLETMLQAVDLWSGVVIAGHALSYGAHAGPIPDTSYGALYRRSYLDGRMVDDLEDACARHFDLVLAAHLALKAVPTEVLGIEGATAEPKPGAAECWAMLVQRHPSLWASVVPTRTVLHVTLLNGTDPFLLDLTIRYAMMQSQKPDEVVLLTTGQPILEDRSDVPERKGHVELHLFEKSLGGVLVSRGETLQMLPHDFLASIRDKAGIVVRGTRSTVLSVMSCEGSTCAPRPLLGQSFERELEPNTVLVFCSAERVANERLLEENFQCLDSCRPHCSQQNWCGQPKIREDGAVYDLTLRRSAGYIDQHAR